MTRLYGDRQAVSTGYGMGNPKCRACGDECLCRDIYLCGTHTHGFGFKAFGLCRPCYEFHPEADHIKNPEKKMVIESLGGEEAAKWADQVLTSRRPDPSGDGFFYEKSPGVGEETWRDTLVRDCLVAIRRDPTLARRKVRGQALNGFNIFMPTLRRYDKRVEGHWKDDKAYTVVLPPVGIVTHPVDVLFWGWPKGEGLVAYSSVWYPGSTETTRAPEKVEPPCLMPKSWALDALVQGGFFGEQETWQGRP